MTPGERPARPLATARALATRAVHATGRFLEPQPATAGELVGWASEVLGDVVGHELQPDRASGRPVVRLERRSGDVAFGKQTSPRHRFAAEHEALRDWAPVLGPRAPQLLGADPKRQLLVMTAVAGRAVRGDAVEDPAVHRAAGVWLGALHASGSREEPDGRHLLERRLRRALDVDTGALTGPDRDFLRVAVDSTPAAPVELVPSHGDFGPHNWLVDERGAFGAVDFGFAGYRPRVWDLTTLSWRIWIGRRPLRRALLEGYGWPLTVEDRAMLRRCTAVHTAEALVAAHRTGRERHAQRLRRALDRMAAHDARPED